MNRLKEYIAKIAIAGLLLLGIPQAYAVVSPPYLGGTGIGSATTTDVGKVLTVSSSSPFTYSFTTPSGGSGATTTINGASGPALTLLISSSTNTLSISTSTNTVTITIPSNLGYFVNDSGFLVQATASSTYVPYTGATTNVNLGSKSFTTTGTTTLSTTTLNNIAASSFLATDANNNIVATTTPSGSSGFTIPAASSTTPVPIINNGNLISTSTLRVYYPMEGNSNDYTGSYNLTDVSVTYSTTTGKFSQGAAYNGSSSHSSTTSKIGLSENGPLTFSFWWKANSLSSSVYSSPFSWDTSDSGGVQFVPQFKSGSLVFDRGQRCIADVKTTYTAAIATSTWYNSVLTYDGTNMNQYLNGSLVSGPTAAGGNGNGCAGSNSFSIGFQQDPVGNYFDGDIDDFSAYSGALTASQVADIYTHSYMTQQYGYSSSTISLATSTKIINTSAGGNSDITITVPGTYLIQPRVNVRLNGASFSSNQTATFYLRRNNNTPTTIANSTSTLNTGVATTSSATLAVNMMPPIIYTTTNTNDNLSIYGILSALPSAGTVDVIETSIMATRLY